MKKAYFVIIIAIAVSFQAAAVEPFFDWNFNNGFKDRIQQREINTYNASNQKLDSNKFLIKQDSGKTVVQLDGASYLRTVFRHTGSQSFYLKIRFSGKPSGTLISRNRASDGLRGIECGLASNKFFVFNGNRPAAMVSAGTRKNIDYILDPAASGLLADRWYEVFLIFSAGKSLELIVIDSEAGKIVFRSQTPCPKVTRLAAEAGNKLLAVGARREYSKSATMFVPAGTLISRFIVWKEALLPETISKVSGIKKVSRIRCRKPGIVYAAPDGKPDGDGSSAAPFPGLQAAFNRLQPGDTLIVKPGVYCERPVLRRGGTPEAPITIRADKVEQGRVVVSAAFPEIRTGKLKWQLEDKSLQLYSVPFQYNPARILYSGTDLMPYPDLDCLKKFTLRKEYPGPQHGFYYSPQEHKLYVRLHPDGRYGSTDPNRHTMAVGATNAPGFNGHHISKTQHANLHIDLSGQAYVTIDGLTFETPGAAGVLTSAGNVTVKNCFFNGCRFGVYGRKAEKVIIENCFYHQFPAFDDMEDVIRRFKSTKVAEIYPIYWWHRKGKGNDSKVMKNYETGIAGGVGLDWIIRRNIIRNAFEGLSCWGNSNSINLQVYGNVFDKLVDNALETENHARNMSIHHNLFKDVFEPISWQPLDGLPWPGPIFVYRNIFYNTRETQELWPWQPGCFKIGVSGRNWQKKAMGGAPLSQLKNLISKRFVMVPYPGFLVFNNTIYTPHAYLLTIPQPMTGKAARELVNFKFFNNVIVAKGMFKKPEFLGSLIEFFNNLCVTATIDLQTKTMAGADGYNFDTLTGAGLQNPAGYNFSLTPSSPAIGHGTLLVDKSNALKDIGAVPAGEQWQMGTPGPCSADGTPVKLNFFKQSLNINKK